MRICTSYLHSREDARYDKVVEKERFGNRFVVLLDGAGLVSSSSFPLPKGRCITVSAGTDGELGIPSMAIVRAADGDSLFSPEPDDGTGSGRMSGVVEEVGHGTVSVGGRQYATEDDGFLMPGMQIAFTVDGGMLEVFDVMERGIAVGPQHFKAATYSTWPSWQPPEQHAVDSRDLFGVTAGKDGDVLVIRMVGRGRPGKAAYGTQYYHRMKQRMASLGAEESKEESGPVWRVDLGKPFSGDKGKAMVGLVHLAGWWLDNEGTIPESMKGIFDELRSWISGRALPGPQDGVPSGK
jgi:hypothetical protein